MHTHFVNRFIAVSSALAAAGILTCAAAFLNVIMPHGSPAAFFLGIVFLALVVAGVMIGFVWLCDRYERNAPRGLEYTVPLANEASPHSVVSKAGATSRFGPAFLAHAQD